MNFFLKLPWHQFEVHVGEVLIESNLLPASCCCTEEYVNRFAVHRKRHKIATNISCSHNNIINLQCDQLKGKLFQTIGEDYMNKVLQTGWNVIFFVFLLFSEKWNFFCYKGLTKVGCWRFRNRLQAKRHVLYLTNETLCSVLGTRRVFFPCNSTGLYHSAYFLISFSGIVSSAKLGKGNFRIK